MSILKNKLKANYSQIPNEIIIDISINAGAFRTLLYLYSKTNNWKVRNEDICKRFNISEKTLTRYWKQLIESGWLIREKQIDKKGKFKGGYVYILQEKTKPIKSSETNKKFRTGTNTTSEQSSEQEQSSDHSNFKNINTNNKKREATQADDFFEYFNSQVENLNLNISKCIILTDKRIIHIEKRFKEKLFSDNWKAIIDKVAESAMLQGENDRGWKVTFDWIINNDENYIKILENKYKSKDTTSKVRTHLAGVQLDPSKFIKGF